MNNGGHRRRRTAFRLVAALAIALAALVTGTVAVNAAASPASSPMLAGHPSVALPAEASGSAAVSALGADLPSVAQTYGMTGAQLIYRFGHDKHLHVDKNGYLFYKEAAPTMASLAGADAAAGAPGVLQALAPLQDTFKLHSLPGAAHVIYLDFDGYTLHADAWTAALNKGNDIIAPPFDSDGIPGSFSDAELTAIQQTWQRVSEDYAPFNVDVSTEYMGEDSITRTSSADNLYGMRVLISPMSGYVGRYGGEAYVGVFNAVGDYYKPALVFPENLANGSRYIADSASHENGHTLGLSHDGTTTGTEYYTGQGSGATGWAPIMGIGYYQQVTQWSKGEYANANNKEDDIAVMGTYGAPLRTDDVGSTIASATDLPGTGALTASGVIGTSNDADYFRVTAGAGALSVSATPAPLGPDLDIRLDLLDSNGSVIASDNPADLLTAGVSASVPPGTYYIRLRGTGKGDPLVDGYTAYGSLGAYTISAAVPNLVGPAAPTITLLNPTSGPTAGGTSVIITGTNFTGASAVTFGGITASYTVNSAIQITATSPAHTAGTADVAVTTDVGSSSTSGTADDFTYTAPVTSTRYDQNSASIAKVGAWANFFTTPAYLGSYGRSSTSGASATIYFTGTRLDWIGMKGTTTGIADVYLDGVFKTTINLAASPAVYQVKVWSTGTLANGAHNVRIVRNTGSAGGKFITLDAVDIWGTINSPPFTSTRYDQNSASIAKVGAWANFFTTPAYLGSYGRSSTSGASATIYFTGTRLDWIGMKGTTTGIADVYLDGVFKTTINLAASPAVYQVKVWSTGTLANGAHNVRIVRNTGSAGGKFITLDAVDIWGTITGP